jgi:dTDP-4-amino-4,6-dideoxy-D-galactose acyltransferase
MNWRQAQAVACLYFLADPNLPESLRLAEESGFHLADLRITLESSDELPKTMPEGVRPWQPQDREGLRAIARISHRDSRFYFDGHFLAERCDDLYDTWINKSLDGYADATLVADVDGRAAGYITCHRDEDEGRIGLVGVHPDFQGRALGQALVKASLAWFAAEGYRKVSVVTQGRNTRAQRLYQRCGFLTRSVQLWYHWWNETKDRDKTHL